MFLQSDRPVLPEQLMGRTDDPEAKKKPERARRQ
jgi:hypothetical protein